MAQLKVNKFTSWELTEEEEIQGKMLTTTQIQVIQNHIADLADEKILLEPDPEHMTAYIKTEAGLAGQIAAYQYLIDESASIEDNQKYIAEEAIADAQSQTPQRAAPVMEIFADSSVVVEPEELNTEAPELPEVLEDSVDPSELPPQSII